MKLWILLVLLFSTTSIANDDEHCVNCESQLSGVKLAKLGEFDKLNSKLKKVSILADDLKICPYFKNDNFKQMIKNLKNKYNTTLEESYFNIKCDNGDLLNMVFLDPENTVYSEAYMRRYFEKKIKKPKVFTKILLNKIEGKNAIERINRVLKNMSENPSFANGPAVKRLTKLKKKYQDYLKKYPLSV